MQHRDLNAEVLPAMTLRQVLEKALREDDTFRRTVRNADPRHFDSATAILRFEAKVPMAQAQEVLRDMP